MQSPRQHQMSRGALRRWSQLLRVVDATGDRDRVRARMRTQRLDLGPAQRMAAAQGLRRQLEQLPEFMTATRIAGYWASAGEIPLNLAIAPLASREQCFFLPVVSSQRQLLFAQWASGEPVTPNRHGIPEPLPGQAPLEPASMDLVLLPLLAFDRRGGRLGSGGGYYDRSFSFLGSRQRPAQPLLVGVAYAFQEQSLLDMHPWDVMLDYVATERTLIACHANAAESQ